MTTTTRYRAVDSDTAEPIALPVTRILVEASLAAGPEGHVLATIEDGGDDLDILSLARPGANEGHALRVYIEESDDGYLPR